ncbi:MAG: hypothetical protein ACAH80_03955 [Alphaproteobacteria bacterium]
MTALTPQQKESLTKLLIEGFKKGDPDMVRGCMDRGCDPLTIAQDAGSGSYRAGIQGAMYYFNEKCANELFATTSVNAKDSSGETPLFTALREGKPAAVEYLMKRGADPLAQNKNGNVASDIAIGMNTNSASGRDLRDRIIKALTGPVVPEEQGPTAQFNTASSTDVKVMKTITLQKPADEGPDDVAPAPGKGPGFKL